MQTTASTGQRRESPGWIADDLNYCLTGRERDVEWAVPGRLIFQAIIAPRDKIDSL